MDESRPQKTAYNTVTAHVRAILNRLHGADVPCCVLRNYEFLTEGAAYNNADLDILVPSEDLRRVESILADFGFVRTRQSTVRRHIGFVAFLEPACLLALDLHLGHPSWNDVPYFSGALLLRETVHRAGVPVPNDRHKALLLILHSLLDKKAFKAEYTSILNRLLEAGLDLNALQDLLGQQVGNAVAEALTAHLKRGDYTGMLRLRPRLIRSLLGCRPGAWFALLCAILRSRWKRLRLAVRPRALLVALVGPHGVGKSTVDRRLTDHLNACGIPVKRFYMGRWHSHLLPLSGIASAYGVSANAPPSKGPPDAPSSADVVRVAGRPFYRLLRDGVYLAEMALRYILRLRPALQRAGIVLTDRYAFDLLFDLNITFLVRIALVRFFPRPHLCFYLYNDAKLLKGRRAEHTLEEIQRQIDVFEAYKDRLGLIPVRADELETTVRQITERVILSYVSRP